nr:SUMF1/EgtB/PvdO family nonheme iron enzyme [uncultured Aminipila sp.]
MKNTAEIIDDRNVKSVMVRIPKFKISDVIEGGAGVTHPAFIVDGNEVEAIYISKYQNTVIDGLAYSLPNKDPEVFVTIEEARNYCKNKGKGWHLMTNDEWAAVALLSKKNNTLPRGNNNYGKDYRCEDQEGTLSENKPCPIEGKPFRILTGSGPVEWSHDGTTDGIYDMNGNVWEWVDGIRTVDCELQLRSQSDGAWRALDGWGNFCKADSEKSLKYKALNTDGTLMLSISASDEQTDKEALISMYKAVKTDADEVFAKKLMPMALIPEGDKYEEDVVAVNVKGTYNAIRGGYWVNKENAGVFALGFILKDDENYFDVGFRCAYYEQ